MNSENKKLLFNFVIIPTYFLCVILFAGFFIPMLLSSTLFPAWVLLIITVLFGIVILFIGKKISQWRIL